MIDLGSAQLGFSPICVYICTARYLGHLYSTGDVQQLPSAKNLVRAIFRWVMAFTEAASTIPEFKLLHRDSYQVPGDLITCQRGTSMERR